MTQLLLFPDPKPLVERLGRDFFRYAPDKPGVYLMRDGQETVLYVGKAKSLRKRLGSYRVANPDRMPKRHLRLLRAVTRIELQECVDEASALDRESLLLRSLKPKFNRAGTWVGAPRNFAWRLGPAGLDLAVASAIDPGWLSYGPLGLAAFAIRGALLRLIWSAVHPAGVMAIPQRWFRGCNETVITISRQGIPALEFERVADLIQQIIEGDAEPIKAWVTKYTAGQNHPFQVAIRQADFEILAEFAHNRRRKLTSASTLNPAFETADGHQ